MGASMTSFAATGWAEEDGTWVYYNRDGERATESWKKSGNSWYWLDENGEMAIDQLIEDDGNYYYVDINGVMASNQWVAIDNEDAGEDDEPDHYWYYFQANGKALKNGDNSKVALKTINGKKYAFDEEGKMLFGWVNQDNAERIDNTDGDAFKEGTYYFGDSDDGAMTTGWLLMDITYDEATADSYKEIAPVFNDDEDQSRWFYFKSNGKKLAAENGNQEKEKTINGKKYAFDEYGAMIAEWSADV
ncbi:argininosuccinate lyase, partial [Lacrimispora sp. 210928-DFI.3.58]|nr:argininosuccinate lyase [Lacrimispora sp. 210928-DFI.3.58]